MKTNLFFKIIIVLLIISNGFTAFLLLKKGKPVHPPFLSEKIGLTGEQLKKAKNIELSHFDEMKPLEVKIEKLHEELFLSVTSTDKRKVDSLKTAISSFILKKDELLLAHFKKIYALCNPTQKQLFITEIKEHFSRRKHPPRK
jgi:hypothetical protein